MAEVAGYIVAIEKAVKKLKEARAVSPETAIPPEQIGIKSRYVLNDLIRYKNVKELENGRIYLECKEEKHC